MYGIGLTFAGMRKGPRATSALLGRRDQLITTADPLGPVTSCMTVRQDFVSDA